MRVLSLIAKTCALALGPGHPAWAAGTWLLGLLADGVAVWRERGRQGRRGALREAAFLQGASLVVGLAVAGACGYAAMRWKDGLPGVAAGAAFLLHALGVPVAAFDGELYLTTMAGALRFAGSPDHLGILIPAEMTALAGVALLLRMPTLKAAFRRLGAVALLMLGAALARWVLSVSLFLALCDFVGYETEELPIAPFVRPESVLLLYLPFLLALGPLLGRLLRAPRAGTAPAPARNARVPLAAALPALGLLFLGAFWEPAGAPKSGDVVINTFHTEWSRTDRPYDRDWYGADSGYNYACLKRWFGVFANVREVKHRLTAADLENASVLMVYLPNVPLSDEEQRLIVEFVRRGGGLLIIGDHTNVFGSTSHLNPICLPFGFYFRDDVLFDLDADFFQLIDLPRWTSAFTHGMTFFKFRGPTSLAPTSLFTRVVMDVGHAKSLRAIYSVNNFYPPPHDHPRMKTGRFAVAVASHFGRGRVAAFADSTIFSNFEIFYPGKYEFLLNLLNWLNHRDGAFTALARRSCLLAALALLAYLLTTTSAPRRWLATVVGTLLAAALAHAAARGVECRRGAFPAPAHPARVLFFATRAEEPAYALRTFTTDAPFDERYDVFIQWVLRTGAFSAFRLSDPGARTELYEHLRRSGRVETGLAFIARRPEDLDQLRELAAGPLRECRRVLLLCSGKIPWSAAAKALRDTGLADGPALARAAAAWPLGEAVVEHAQRRLVVVAGAERFSDQAMGYSEKVVPTPEQRALFAQAFRLVDVLFNVASSPAAAPSVRTPAAASAPSTP